MGGFWGPIYTLHTQIHSKTTPTVPNLRRSKALPTYHSHLGLYSGYPPDPPGGEKVRKVHKMAGGKMAENGENCPPGAPQDPPPRQTDPRKNGLARTKSIAG